MARDFISDRKVLLKIGSNNIITINDGIWTQKDGCNIWTICISVPVQNVKSLHLFFRDVNFVPDAQLYIYSSDGQYITYTYSEDFITPKLRFHLATGNYSTIVIQVVEPAGSNQKSTFEIYAIAALLSDMQDRASLACEEDIACYPNWNNDSYGICKINYSKVISPIEIKYFNGTWARTFR